MNKIGIGVIGCGTVGSGLIRNLPKANALIGERLGVQLEIKSIAVRNSAKNRDPLPITPVEDWKKVISDPAVQIVVELVGGTHDAFLIAEATLKAKKPLVTANKALLAERGKSCSHSPKNQPPPSTLRPASPEAFLFSKDCAKA